MYNKNNGLLRHCEPNIRFQRIWRGNPLFMSLPIKNFDDN